MMTKLLVFIEMEIKKMKKLACLTLGLLVSLSCYARSEDVDRFDFYYSQHQYDEALRLKKIGMGCFSFLTVNGKTIPFTEVVIKNYIPLSKYQDFEKVAENIIIDKGATITKKCS